MTSARLVSFRFEPADLERLDKVVSWYRSENALTAWGPQINRTTMLKSLIMDAIAAIIRKEQAKLDMEVAPKPKPKPASKKKVKHTKEITNARKKQTSVP